VFASVCSRLLAFCCLLTARCLRLFTVGTKANESRQLRPRLVRQVPWFHVDGWTDPIGLDESIETCKVLPTDLSVVAMSSKDQHAACVTESGNVFTWGSNFYGQLGREDTDRGCPELVPWLAHGGSPAVMVACACEYVLVLTGNGSVYTTDAGSEYHTHEHGTWGPRGLFLVQAEGFTDIVMVAAGFHHNVALKSAGEVFTWGEGGRGQLGHADINLDFMDADDYIDADSEDGVDLGCDAPRLIVSEALYGSTAVQVAAGGTHTAIVTREGELWTFGTGDGGQLGHIDRLEKRVPTCVQSESSFGGSPVVSAACGACFTMALTMVGAVWTFGGNIDGALGHGHCDCLAVPRQIEQRHFGDTKIVSVSGGFRHAAAVTQQGALYTWGDRGSEHRLPTLVGPSSLLNARIGRFQELLPSHAVAFAMGTHARLGGGNPSRRSMRQKDKRPSTTVKGIPCVYVLMPAELVKRIIEASGMAPAGFGNMRRYPGFTRMLGCI